MINLYIADINALSKKETFQEYYRKIDKVRQEKVNRCKNETDQKRSLLAGYLLQIGVRNKMNEGSGWQSDAVPLSLSYTYGENGKPYLKQIPNTFFSLSHSGSYVICAISEEEVGADIQEHRELKTDVASRFFSKEEKILLEKENGDSHLFYHMWAIKESHMKLTGLGMRQGMDSTIIKCNLSSSDCNMMQEGIIICKNKENKQANYLLYDKIKGYSVALCSYSKNKHVTIDKVIL